MTTQYIHVVTEKCAKNSNSWIIQILTGGEKINETSENAEIIYSGA